MYRRWLFIALAALSVALTTFYAWAKPQTITMRGHIVDMATGEPVKATIFVDGSPVAVDVTDFTVHLPADGQPHNVEVHAPGYYIWGLNLRGKGEHILEGPVRLIPEPAKTKGAGLSSAPAHGGNHGEPAR